MRLETTYYTAPAYPECLREIDLTIGKTQSLLFVQVISQRSWQGADWFLRNIMQHRTLTIEYRLAPIKPHLAIYRRNLTRRSDKRIPRHYNRQRTRTSWRERQIKQPRPGITTRKNVFKLVQSYMTTCESICFLRVLTMIGCIWDCWCRGVFCIQRASWEIATGGVRSLS